MKEQGDLFSSCVPVSVERSDQNKDADENVDADHVGTGRPVESEQSIDLFTQREDIDIDFSGCLDCHMQLWNKQTTFVFANSWRRSRVILIDKRFKLFKKKKNTHNPFREKSKV